MQKLGISTEEMNDLTISLQKVDFFSDLTIGYIDLVLKYVQHYAYKVKQAIFKQGDPGDALYVIHEGQVKIGVKRGLLLPDKTLAVLKPGQFFGEMALLDRRPRSATAKTVTDTKLFVLLSSDFDVVLRKNPNFAAEMRRIADHRHFEKSHLPK